MPVNTINTGWDLSQWRQPSAQPPQQQTMFGSTLNGAGQNSNNYTPSASSPTWATNAGQMGQAAGASPRYGQGSSQGQSMFGNPNQGYMTPDVYTTQPVSDDYFTRAAMQRDASTRAGARPPMQMPGSVQDQWYTSGPAPYPSWDPNVPTAGTLDPGSPANPGNQAGHPADQSTWDWYKANSQQLSNYIPYAQFMQNAYQYGMDFNEAQRRYNQEFGWQQQQDQFNMGLAGRQQTMAEWQASESARQWQDQFGYTQQRDTQEFQLANDQLAVERAYRQGLISNEQRNLALQELKQRDDNTLGNRQADIEAAYRQGLITNEQRNLALQETKQRQDYELQGQSNNIEAAYRQGLITNEQRNLALQELAQQQNNAIQQGQLQFSRDELAALQQWRNTEAGLRQQELANNLTAARYSAFGRAQAPGQGRFQRNW